MSESDVSTIRDEDVLRRMWQQAEDFGRKKEIRAHMYRLREERLRNLYTQEDKPTQRTEAKGQEFSTSQGHTKSFADQSFQSIKSKEVRDAGSPPREYSYQTQDLKEKSNTGWNVQSENKTTDDGHTQVQTIQAEVAGQYDVDGGSGLFAAVDKHKQAVTEYHDDNMSIQTKESASNTSAHDEFVRKTDDGATFESTMTTSSSKVQQTSSIMHDFDAPVDIVDYSDRNRQRSQKDPSGEYTSFRTMSHNFKSNRSQVIAGELTSRKVEYPDEHTKLIIETRKFPDGSTATSTRRETRGPLIQTGHSEQRSHQSRSESKSSKTSLSQCNIADNRREIKFDNTDRTEDNTKIENIIENVDRPKQGETGQKQDFASNDIRQDYKTEFVIHDSKQDMKEKNDPKHDNEVYRIHTNHAETTENARSCVERETVDKNYQEESHYQTTYQSDFTQKKISTDLSPTHQAWASSLRADTPATPHGSVRGSSPASRTSTSSVRSSVSPDKYVRRPSSRGGSPTKHDRHSPARNETDHHTTFTRVTSPERKPAQSYRHSPSPTRRPKDSYRFVDEETKRSTKFISHHTDTDSDTIMNIKYTSSPETYSRSHDNSPSPSRKSPSKDYVSNKNSKNYSYIKDYMKNYSNTSDDITTVKTNIYSKQSPTREIKRHQSPPKVSFETDVDKHSEIRLSKTTNEQSDELKINKTDTSPHNRFSSPTKSTRACPTESTRVSKSPEKQSPTRQVPKDRSLSPTKNVTCGDESPLKKVLRSGTTPVKSLTREKYHTSSTDFIAAEKSREVKNRNTVTEHPRQLLTPSTSPTRKPKQVDETPSTGVSSPTTSVSEIVYFSSPQDHRQSTLVADVVDDQITSHITTRKEIIIADKRPKTLDVKRSPSPSKIPCREKSPEKTSPVMDTLPRKSSLKKPSSDSLQISPSEKAPTSFYMSPTEDTKSFPEHKIVKKDRPDKFEPTTKVKERPPFTRSETYEERCRKILGMSDKDSLVLEAEKTVSKILDKLPLDIKPTESSKTSSSISPCTSPVRESSPLTEFPSQRKITNEKSNYVSDFISHEKETGEKTTDYISKYKDSSPKVTSKSKTPSRESSPNKLQSTVSDCTTKTVTTKNIQGNMEEVKMTNIRGPLPANNHRSSVSPQRIPAAESPPVKSSRSSISPQRKPTAATDNDIKLGPQKSHIPDSDTVYNEEFISEEKKQAIINRVEKTLRNISPNRDVTEKRSASREQSPSKNTTRLQDIIAEDTKINNTKADIIYKVGNSMDKKTVEKNKETEKVTTHNQVATNQIGSKPGNRNASPIKRPTMESKSPKSSFHSRTESPNTSRSISPKKTVSGLDKVTQSHIADKTVNCHKTVQSIDSNNTKSTTRKPSQRKYNDNITIDITKKSNLTKQNSFSKTTVKSSISKNIHNKSIITAAQIESDSEDDERITTTRLGSSDKADNRRNSRFHQNKENPTPKPIVDLKITRTTSDTTIKTNKAAPTRNKSKPEISVTGVTKTKTASKQTASTTTKTIHKVNKLKTNEPRTNLTSKPKSATTLSQITNDDIIIDIQQAKSSRENSPDRICPTPVSFLEDSGKPRLPDNVREPDDEYRRHTNTTIHETESIVDDIVEIIEEEDNTKKISEVDRVTGSDECLLSVTDKVNKFLIKADNLANTKDKTYSFKETEKAVHLDYIADESDDCLLSVSEKVSKFASPKPTRKNPSKDLSQNYDENAYYQDDYTKMNINDKANLFVKTAEDIIAPIKHLEPAPKVDRPDLSDVHESLKTDECLLSVSDKVYKFVKSAEQFLSETDNMQKVSKNTENFKSKHDHDKLESYAKETVSSHAKVRDCVSPNIKSQDKTPIGKITTLRSNEAVKKAKALFENIASENKVESHSTLKGTKLTDIGVYKKSTPTDSTTVLHPSLEEGSPNLTDTESEIDIAPHVRGNNSTLTHGLHDQSQHYQKPITNGIHKTNQKILNRSRKSPERSYVRSPERYTKMDSNTREDIHKRESLRKQDITSTKSVLSRYPVKYSDEPIKEPKKEPVRKPTAKYIASDSALKIAEPENAYDDIVSSRRGSGKFGVELRRTSVEKASSERRRSSGTEAHPQPCIEDIFDLELLEQMLEKVVGYEQRRRIRAQMRLAKSTEAKHTVDTNTYTRHSSSQQQKKIVTEIDWRNKSPDRKPTTNKLHTQPEKPISHTPRKVTKDSPNNQIRNLSPDKSSRSPVINKTMSPNRHPSPEKKVRPLSPEKKNRHASPEKRTRTQSPSKITVSPKNKTNRFNEYASAYMKKVGIEEPVKNYTDVTKKTRETKSEVSNQYSTATKTSFEIKTSTERRSSKDIVEVINVNGKHTPVSSPESKRRTPSPAKKPVNDHIRPRSPSPGFKKPRNDADTLAKFRLDNEKKVIVTEEKPSWVTNRGLKKTITSEARTFSSKKFESEKPKYRSVSPSKVIAKPTDVITSSYGLGPMDAEGRPLFGIKALRNGANNIQVKGTVIRSEYHSTNGSEPVGEVSVTAYSTDPNELASLLEAQGGTEGPVRQALQERQQSKLHGLSAITTTKKFGGKTGTTISNVHTKEERQALQDFTKGHSDKRTVRQSSVKSLTEKFIKNAVDTTKSEKSSYPKAGLILRSSGVKDNVSADSDTQAGIIRSDSEHNLYPAEDMKVVKEVSSKGHQGRTETRVTTRTVKTDSKSFLDSDTKVTGVQDILTRMKNADIVIEDGDTLEDTEARALLNKFLGATVLMAGMEAYVTEKPAGKVSARAENRSARAATGGDSGAGGPQRGAESSRVDVESIWDEAVLRRLLEECIDYEQRRRIRARLRQVMAEQEACAEVVRSTESAETEETTDAAEREEVSTTMSSTVRRNSSEKTVNSSTTTTSKVIESVSRTAPKPASPFAKFRQLEKQNSTSGPKM